MSRAAAAYRSLPADERQEFRLPALLKDHLAQAAALAGQSVAEYVTSAVAERVSTDLTAVPSWSLTVPEQQALVKVLAQAASPSPRARQTAERAEALFADGRASE